MPSVATTSRRMETFARALDRAAANSVVPRARIDQLRSAFIATDGEGRSWTIDPEFQRWGRLDGERWMVDDPPPQLFMDSELRASLEALEAMAARAIVRGADAPAPRTSWFRAPVAPTEPARMSASIPSRESDTAPPPPRDREEAPRAEPARSSESIPPRVSAPPETLPPRAATEESVVGLLRAASVTPVEETAPSRPAFHEAHRRFAGPFASVSEDAATPASTVMAARETTPAPAHVPASADPPASVPPREASHDPERWVPTSIAPRLTTVRPVARDDRAHVVLCGLLATLFFALAVWKGDGRGYAAAFLFGLLAITLLVFNLARNRHD